MVMGIIQEHCEPSLRKIKIDYTMKIEKTFHSIEKKYTKSMLLLVVMLLGFNSIWAQPTPSTATELNLYRLQSVSGTSYYLVPGGTTDGSYVKTSNTTNGDDLNNVNRISAYWYFEQSGTQYYIRNLATGQYLYCPTVTDGTNRVTVRSSSNKTLFTFSSSGGGYNIFPEGTTYYSMNPYGGNPNNIGLYQYNNNGSRWNYTNKITSTLEGGLSDFSISGNTTLDALTTVTTANYSHTNASYASPHFQFTINGTTYYKGTTGNPSTTAPTGSTSGITYSWSLSDNMTGYATVSSSGAITYSTLVPEASRTATLTCTATHTSGATKEATYTITFINPTILQEPVISYTMASDGLQVTLTHPTSGVTIYYTKDGSDPQTSTTRLIYSAPFNVENNTTVKAYAVKEGMTSSPVASELLQLSSGIVGNTLIVYDYEDHNWSYYKGLDYTLEDGTTTYNDKYKYSLYSPDPRNVKITYKGVDRSGYLGANVAVSNSEPVNQFVFYETLEKYVIGFFTQHQTDGDYDGTPANPNNTAEQYPYTVISNPFSKRPPATGTGPKTYYGFAGWKITDGWEYIIRANGNPAHENDVLELDEIIHFTNWNPNYTPNCTSAEVVFEATWTQATVHTSQSTDAYSFSGGTYETNFVVSTNTDVGTVSPSSPCTITAIYPDGTNDNSTSRTITGLTVSTSGTEPKNNTVKVEWIRHGNGTFNANGKNMILGRGITSSSNQGTIYCSNSNAPCVNIVKIESGNYKTMTPINTAISATNAVNTYITFGCDYDKARANYYSTATNAYNTKLQISGMSWSRMAEANRSHGDLYIRTLFKSGKFTGEHYAHTASTQGQRFITIKGGYFTGDITCGSEVDYNQDNARAVTLHIRGDVRVDGRIAGGSTSRNCSGDRCIVITGGRICGWIAAGSNSKSTSNGVTQGETFVYIGGNAEVNSRQFGADWTHLFNTSSGGVVYGSGCGINHNSTAGGVTKGSNVVLADNAYVERGIYGGGAMGRISEGGTSNIFVLGGHVGTGQGKINDSANPSDQQNVTVTKTGIFGGACNVGGGYSNIYMNGGVVEGGVFGGSNINGSMDNNAKVEIVGGQVGTASLNANVHGGGYGNATRVVGSVNVTVGKQNATDGATIYGDVYGGSAEGKTNCDSDDNSTTDAVTNVTLNAGTINGSLYGGGLGTSANAADVFGPVTVTVNGGEVTNVFGCNNANGEPKDTVSVIINGTKATVINSGDTTYAIKGVYGGGNLSDYYTYAQAPIVVVNNCATSIEDVYGGGNAAAVPATNVTINGGDINRVFGGGNGASGDPAHVGCRTSSTTTTVGNGNVLVNINGGTINQVFGGSNKTGEIIGTSTINVGATSSSCSMDVKSLFAGGNEAASNGGTINVSCGAKLGDVYGGANKADIGTSTSPADVNLTINGGNIHRVFGGNNASGTIYGKITVNINVTGTCSDTIGYVYGGGNQAPYVAPTDTPDYPEVNVIKGNVAHDVYGGGLGLKTDATKGTITGNPQVKIYQGQTGGKDNVKIGGNVFGGGNAGKVIGNTNVQVGVTE